MLAHRVSAKTWSFDGTVCKPGQISTSHSGAGQCLATTTWMIISCPSSIKVEKHRFWWIRKVRGDTTTSNVTTGRSLHGQHMPSLILVSEALHESLLLDAECVCMSIKQLYTRISDSMHAGCR